MSTMMPTPQMQEQLDWRQHHQRHKALLPSSSAAAVANTGVPTVAAAAMAAAAASRGRNGDTAATPPMATITTTSNTLVKTSPAFSPKSITPTLIPRTMDYGADLEDGIEYPSSIHDNAMTGMNLASQSNADVRTNSNATTGNSRVMDIGGGSPSMPTFVPPSSAIILPRSAKRFNHHQPGSPGTNPLSQSHSQAQAQVRAQPDALLPSRPAPWSMGRKRPQLQPQRQPSQRRLRDRSKFLRKASGSRSLSLQSSGSSPTSSSPPISAQASQVLNANADTGDDKVRTSGNSRDAGTNGIYSSHISHRQTSFPNSERWLTYQEYSESEESSYDLHNNFDDASSYMDEEAINIMGRKDTKRAAILRCIVIMLFISMSIGAPIIIHDTIRDSQQDQLNRHFDSSLLLDHFATQYQQWKTSMEAMSISITLSSSAMEDSIVAIANVNNRTTLWPFQNIPNFDYHAEILRDSLPYLSVSLLPILDDGEKELWQTYSQDAAQAWVADASSYVSWYPYSVAEDAATITHTIREYDGAQTTTTTEILPTWQTVPTIGSNINLDQLSVPFQSNALQQTLQQSKLSMTRVLPTDFVNNYFQHLQIGEGDDGNNAETGKKEHPMITMNIPVFNSLDASEREIVAILSATASFDELLSLQISDMADTDNGDAPTMVVVENACGDVFSYHVTSTSTTFLDNSDRHHSKFNGLEQSITWETGIDDNGADSLCPNYNIRIYPTGSMEDQFTSSLPLTLALSLAALVVLIAVMAMTYDYFVQRRMWNAVKSARESRAIVSSLFPANVRDRLLQEEEEKATEIERNANMTQPLRRMSMSLLGAGAGGSVNGSVNGGKDHSTSHYGGNGGGTERRKSFDQGIATNGNSNNGNSNSNGSINYHHKAGRRRSNDSSGRRRSNDSGGRRRSNDSGSRRRSNDSGSRRRSNDSGHRSNSDSNNVAPRRASMHQDKIFKGVPDMLFSGAMAGFAALAPPKLRLKFVLNQDHSRHSERDDVPDDDSFELVLPDKPIADLFPNCTVLFGDISGFTAWSSEREPEQVFTLLQTIFQSFDILARRRAVYKVETIGDCYVAVTGCPDRQDDHAVRMTKFARACMQKVAKITKKLEVQLGPGTGDLTMRFGLHSGPVTAGVLRGEKSRFQLFGDTVNTASRMESTGMRSRIQISNTTADQLIQAGKANWILERSDVVYAKGKGAVKTYWVLTAREPKDGSERSAIKKASIRPSRYNQIDETSDEGSLMSDNGSVWGFDENITEQVSDTMNSQLALKYGRWIDWQVDLFAKLLKQLSAGRRRDMSNPMEDPANVVTRGEPVVDEVSETINMPQFDPRAAKARARPTTIQLPKEVMSELREYVTRIAALYHEGNPFHNFAHASHVCMSASKLLSRIVKPEDVNYHRSSVKAIASDLHDYTFGITSDPLTHVAIMFSALVHDVDHSGVSNAQLGKENPGMAEKYRSRSIAESNSIDIAWDMLTDSAFSNLQQCMFADESELMRFRQMVVNMVISTDIFDKAGKEMQKNRWEKAFHPDNQDADLKASIVIEAIIQAADVAHTMQHWQVYTRWNEKLFQEMYRAYENGRAMKDPSLGWYKGELWFFDNYIIPLAGKLEKCGIFGVSIDECLNYAIDNRREWADKGEAIVERMVRRYKESKCAEVDTAVVLHSQEEVILFNNSNSKDDTSSNKSTKASTVVEDDTLNIDMTPTLKPKSTVSRGSVATADIRPPTLTDETVDDVSIAFSTDSEEVDC